MGVGIVTLGIAYAVGRIDFFPEPAGLILSLIGLLVTTNGFYVWMSTEGPLSSEEEGLLFLRVILFFHHNCEINQQR